MHSLRAGLCACAGVGNESHYEECHATQRLLYTRHERKCFPLLSIPIHNCKPSPERPLPAAPRRNEKLQFKMSEKFIHALILFLGGIR